MFLDVDDLDDIGMLETHLQNARVVLLFLSKGYFHSRACLLEVRCAFKHEKPLILVLEKDAMHGGTSLVELRDECPAELRGFVFNKQRNGQVINWNRTSEFQLVSLLRIADALLGECSFGDSSQDRLSSSSLSSSMLRRSFGKAPPARTSTPGQTKLFVPSALTEQPLMLANEVWVMVSPAHPPARTVANELRDRLSDATAEARIDANAKIVVSMLPQRLETLVNKINECVRRPGTRLCFLLVLDRATFGLNDAGDAVAQHVRTARASNVPLLLCHDSSSCDFDTCIEMTPDDLIQTGLYMKQVAVPLGEHPSERAAASTLLLRQLERLPAPRRAGKGSLEGNRTGILSSLGLRSTNNSSVGRRSSGEESELDDEGEHAAQIAARLKAAAAASGASHAHVHQIAAERRRSSLTGARRAGGSNRQLLGDRDGVRASPQAQPLPPPLRASSSKSVLTA